MCFSFSRLVNLTPLCTSRIHPPYDVFYFISRSVRLFSATEKKNVSERFSKCSRRACSPHFSFRAPESNCVKMSIATISCALGLDPIFEDEEKASSVKAAAVKSQTASSKRCSKKDLLWIFELGSTRRRAELQRQGRGPQSGYLYLQGRLSASPRASSSPITISPSPSTVSSSSNLNHVDSAVSSPCSSLRKFDLLEDLSHSDSFV